MPRKKGKKKNKFRWILIGAGICIAAFVSLFALTFLTAPDVAALRGKNPKETAMMRYREIRAKAEGQRTGRLQIWVPLSRISPNLIRAVLISEDDKFFIHGGFDWEGIRDALEKNVRYGHIIGGGSTITQQLAKNLYLKPTRNPVRKIREAAIAYLLDKRLKKNRILELYLNVIEWGGGIYGAEAAARVYFSIPASDLSLPQAVRMASVLPSPLRFRPDSDTSPWMIRRRRSISERMLKRHLITEEQYRELLVDVDPEARSVISDSLFVHSDTTDTLPRPALLSPTDIEPAKPGSSDSTLD